MEDFSDMDIGEMKKMIEKYEYRKMEKLVSKLVDQKLDQIESRIAGGFHRQIAEEIAKNKGMEKEIEELRQNLENCREQNHTLESEKKQKETQLEELQRKLETVWEKNQSLESEKEQKRAQLEELQRNLETSQKQNQSLKNETEGKDRRLEELRQELENLQTKNQSLQSEKEQKEEKLEKAQQELKECRDCISKSEDDKKELKKENEAMQEQRKEYNRACENRWGEDFPFIDIRTYESYILSVCNENAISLIYSRMKQEHKSGKDEMVEKWDQLIEDCIEIFHRAYGAGIFRRQNTEIGQLYDSMRFDKVWGTKETGKVSKIIYRGIEKKGDILCRSLVEVE